MKIFILSIVLSLVLVFTVGTAVLAEETTNTTESIQAQSLEVGNPKILPDSPFYFLKTIWRKIQDITTLNPLKKIELKMRFSNEKIIEMEKLAEKTQNQKTLNKAIDNYKQEIDDIGNGAEKIKDILKNNEEINKFINKFTQQQVLHQQILQKLESQVPTEVFEKIKELRERHLEKFQGVMEKLQNREQNENEDKNEDSQGSEAQNQNREKNGCNDMWWYDNDYKYCQQKKFCGMYMYFGLQTFNTKEECEKSLNK